MKKDELLRLSRGLVRVSKGREILHVVPGHSVGGTLRASDIPSDNIVVWYDLLTTGPARGENLEETTRIRTRYFRRAFKSRRLKNEILLPPSYARRNCVLRRCGEWREVALWFGPSVVEQFSLLQVLATIAEQDLGKTRTTLVTCPKFRLAVYRPEKLSEFFQLRVRFSRRQMELARRVWELYCKPDPMPLFHFAETHAESESILCNAIRRQLERYPSVHNGLSLIEEALLRGVESERTVVGAVAHVLEDDSQSRVVNDELFDSLLELFTCATPLVERVEEGKPVKSHLEFRRLAVRLSTAGRDVLAGRADQIALNGIDRWIGGVRLEGKRVRWRWDAKKRVLKVC